MTVCARAGKIVDKSIAAKIQMRTAFGKFRSNMINPQNVVIPTEGDDRNAENVSKAVDTGMECVGITVCR